MSTRTSPIVTTWGLAVQGNVHQTVMGQGDGLNGWRPRWPILLKRLTLQGYPLSNSGTGGLMHAIVTKNGIAPGDELFNLSHDVVPSPSLNTGGYIVEQFGSELVEPSDFLVVRIGHLTPSTGTPITAQVAMVLEAEVMTGPASSSGKASIGMDHRTRLLHVNGSVNSLNPFWLMGMGNDIYPQNPFNATQAPDVGWPVPGPMVIRRLVMSAHVNNPVALPDQNTARFLVWVDDPTSAPISELTINLNAFKFNTTARNINVPVDSSNTLFAQLIQTKESGSGTATVLDVSVVLEVEYA